MAVASLVPLEEYLSTSYEVDQEYVDGRLVERNEGEFRHRFLQVAITSALKAVGPRAYTELRFQVKQQCFRVPDVLALAPDQLRACRYQQEAPYIVVEILSPEDRVEELNEKLDDYLAIGVPNIWVVDPEAETETLKSHQLGESHTYRDRVVTAEGAVTLDLADMFRQ